MGNPPLFFTLRVLFQPSRNMNIEYCVMNCKLFAVRPTTRRIKYDKLHGIHSNTSNTTIHTNEKEEHKLKFHSKATITTYDTTPKTNTFFIKLPSPSQPAEQALRVQNGLHSQH